MGSNRSSAASTLCLDLVEEGGGDLVGGNLASTVPAPCKEKWGGAWNLLEKVVCFALEEKNGAAPAMWDEDDETGVSSPRMDTLGYDTVVGEEMDCHAAAGEDDRDGSSPARSSSHVTGDGPGRDWGRQDDV